MRRLWGKRIDITGYTGGISHYSLINIVLLLFLLSFNIDEDDYKLHHLRQSYVMFHV